MTMAIIITMVSMVLIVTVGDIIVTSVVMPVVALVEAVAVAMEASEVIMARKDPLTMISTNTVDIVRELVTIFISAGCMQRIKKRKRRRIVILLVRAEVMGLLVKQSNINQASFALILIYPLMSRVRRQPVATWTILEPHGARGGCMGYGEDAWDMARMPGA